SRLAAVRRARDDALRARASAPLSPRRSGVPDASRGEAELAERGPRRAGLIPRQLLLADDDRALVALPGEEHGIAGSRPADRLAHRGGAIVDDQIIGAGAFPGTDRTGLDLAQDRRAILQTRVLLCDHEEIGVLRGSLGEPRALDAIALTRATEDRDELP